MGRYQVEREESWGSVWVIRDTATSELVEQRVLRTPERFRSEPKARRRVAELEERDRRARLPGPGQWQEWID